jgi:glutaredoxin
MGRKHDMETIKIAGKRKEHKVLVYALSTCVWCKQTKKYLKDKDVEYEYVDVDLSNKEDTAKIHKHILSKGGRLVFPTVIIDDKVLINGHHEDQLKRALEL